MNPHHAPPAPPPTPPPMAEATTTTLSQGTLPPDGGGLSSPAPAALEGTVAVVFIVAMALVLAALLAVAAAVRLRAAPPRRGGGGAEAAPAGWEGRYLYTPARLILRRALSGLQARVRRAGTPLPVGASVWETARAAGGVVPGEAAAEFARRYDAYMYGPSEPGVEEARRTAGLVGEA